MDCERIEVSYQDSARKHWRVIGKYDRDTAQRRLEYFKSINPGALYKTREVVTALISKKDVVKWAI